MSISLSEFPPICDTYAPHIISREKSCEHRANNKTLKRVRHYKIDGGVISDVNIIKCDYLLINDDSEKAYFIELKGSDISHAIKQIEATVAMFRNELSGYIFLFRIIYRTGSHSIHDRRITEWKKKYRGKQIIRQGSYEEDI